MGEHILCAVVIIVCLMLARDILLEVYKIASLNGGFARGWKFTVGVLGKSRKEREKIIAGQEKNLNEVIELNRTVKNEMALETQALREIGEMVTKLGDRIDKVEEDLVEVKASVATNGEMLRKRGGAGSGCCCCESGGDGSEFRLIGEVMRADGVILGEDGKPKPYVTDGGKGVGTGETISGKGEEGETGKGKSKGGKEVRNVSAARDAKTNGAAAGKPTEGSPWSQRDLFDYE